MKQARALVVICFLGCNEADEAASGEGTGGGEGSSGMPEWEDGAPGATCPEEYDPDRVYVAMQQLRFHSLMWVVRDIDEQEVECSYKWEGNDFLDAIVHPGRRAVLLSMETRDGLELRLPQPRAVERREAPGDPSVFIWDLVSAPNTDVTLFEITDDPQTHCGDVLRRWWPDATVMFSCFAEPWRGEDGMPRLDDFFVDVDFDFVGNEALFTLSGSRVVLDHAVYDLVALEEQRSDYVPFEFDDGWNSIVLAARSLSDGTSDAIVVQTWTDCFGCDDPSDLVLRRFLLSGDAVVDEREYLWPRDIELEASQIVLDGEGRWVAHVQEPAPDGRMFEKVIRGEPDGSETVLLEAPSFVDYDSEDSSAIRIGRVFTGA